MVTWYGQHIRFKQGSCQFLGGRGESFLLPKVGTWGFFCAEQHGLAGWFNIHYLCFYFLFLFLLVPTLPTCTLLTLDPYFFSLRRRLVGEAKSTLFFLIPHLCISVRDGTCSLLLSTEVHLRIT